MCQKDCKNWDNPTIFTFFTNCHSLVDKSPSSSSISAKAEINGFCDLSQQTKNNQNADALFYLKFDDNKAVAGGLLFIGAVV